MFKYTLKNIMRAPFRSFAIFLILTVLFTGVMVTYSISVSAKKNMEDMRMDMGGRVSLEVDIESYIDEYVKYQQGTTKTMPTMKKLEWAQVDRISKSEYVQDYNITIEGAGTSNIKPYTLESTKETTEGNPDFRIIGDKQLNYNNDFYYKEKALVEGKGFTAEDVDSNAQVAVIDRRLADLNELNIGDVFKFTSIEGVDMEFEIIGIYEDTVEDIESMSTATYMLRANCIYIPYTTAMESRGNTSYKDLITETAFFVKDPLKIEEFKSNLYRTTIQLKGYILNADDAVYEKKVLPLVYVKSIAEQPGKIALIGGISLSLILIIITALRKKSSATGLRVMGLNTNKTYRFIVSDLSVIILFSFILSLVISLLFIQPLADRAISSTRYAVDSVIALSEKDAIENSYLGGGLMESMKVDPVYEISAGLKPVVFLATTAIAFVLLAFYYALCKRSFNAGNPMTAGHEA